MRLYCKDQMNLSQEDNWAPGLDLNLRLSEYEAGVPVTQHHDSYPEYVIISLTSGS